MAALASNSSDPVWQRLSTELQAYSTKIDAAKAQFDDLNVSIDEFTKQLDAAAQRERKISSMLESFMDRIDASEESPARSSPARSSPARSSPARSAAPSSPSLLRASDLDGPSPMKLTAPGSNNVHISRRGSITISR